MNIVLFGHIGHGNVGDVLLFSRAIRDLNSLGIPDMRITAVSKLPFKEQERFPGVTHIEKYKFFAAAKATAQADAAIYIGYIFREENRRRSLWYYTWLNRIAKTAKTKIIFYGVSFGPFHSRRKRYLAKRTANLVDAASFRDYPSLNAFEDFLNPKRDPYAIKTRDLLLARERTLDDVRKRKREVLVVLGALPNAKAERAVVALLETLSKAKIKTLVASFYPYEEAGLMHRIRHALPGTRIFDTKNYFDIIRRLPQFPLVIGMRYHALVLAYNAGCNVIAISLSRRMREFANELGAIYYNLETINSPAFIRNVFDLMDYRQKPPQESAEIQNIDFLRYTLPKAVKQTKK